MSHPGPHCNEIQGRRLHASQSLYDSIASENEAVDEFGSKAVRKVRPCVHLLCTADTATLFRLFITTHHSAGTVAEIGELIGPSSSRLLISPRKSCQFHAQGNSDETNPGQSSPTARDVVQLPPVVKRHAQKPSSNLSRCTAERSHPGSAVWSAVLMMAPATGSHPCSRPSSTLPILGISARSNSALPLSLPFSFGSRKRIDHC